MGSTGSVEERFTLQMLERAVKAAAQNPNGIVPVLGYYFFPWNVQQDDAPPPPPPTNTLEVLKLNEEAVEKILTDMPKIQKLIIYRTLYAEGVRMEGIDRAIVKEAKEQLKAIKAATP